MMKIKIDKSYIVIVALVALAGVVSWKSYFQSYRQKDTISIHTFPKQIGDWSSEELTITDDERAILETNNVFARRYTTPEGREAILMIVYSQDNRKVSHPPEICYTGAGISVLDKRVDPLVSLSENTNLNANRLVLEQGNTRQIAYYWFKVNQDFTPTYWKQQALVALNTLLGKRPSSALIRVSVSTEKGEEEAAANAQEFTKLIIPSLKKYLP